MLRQAMEDGMTLEEIFEYTNIDPWFLNQLSEIHQAEQWIKSKALDEISKDDFIQTKKRGFSDIQISRITGKKKSQSIHSNANDGSSRLTDSAPHAL